MIGLFLFIIFDKKVPNGGELFINLFLAFYTAQLAFFPHIFGILFLKKHPSPFWANLSMIVGATLGISIGVYAVLVKPDWGWYPIIICFFSSSLIYYLGIVFSNSDKLKSFVSKNRFFTVLMSVSLLAIAISTMYYAPRSEYTNIVHTWELISYIITLLFSLWFWFKNPNGRSIYNDIFKENPFNGLTFFAMFILMFAITVMHIFLVVAKTKLPLIIQSNTVSISLSLLILIYIIFYYINKTVIVKTTNTTIKKDFSDAFRYIDFPVLITFGLFFIYSLFINIFGHTESLEMFFGGAIAFELLISSFLWAQTETV